MGTLKTRSWKRRHWKTRDQITKMEKAALENAGPCGTGWKTRDWKKRNLKSMESVTIFKSKSYTEQRSRQFTATIRLMTLTPAQTPSSRPSPPQPLTATTSCEVCLVAHRDPRIALVPCGHQRFCEQCANEVERQGRGCPI